MHIFAASQRPEIQARRASEWVRGGLSIANQTHSLARRACIIPASGPYEDVDRSAVQRAYSTVVRLDGDTRNAESPFAPRAAWEDGKGVTGKELGLRQSGHPRGEGTVALGRAAGGVAESRDALGRPSVPAVGLCRLPGRSYEPAGPRRRRKAQGTRPGRLPVSGLV